MGVNLRAGEALRLALRALWRRELLLPVLLVEAPLLAVGLVAVAVLLGALVVSPLVLIAALLQPRVATGAHLVLLSEIERRRLVAWWLATAVPWLLLQAAWRAGFSAAAEALLRDGRAGWRDWRDGLVQGLVMVGARRLVGLMVSLVLLLTTLLALTRLGGPVPLWWLVVASTAVSAGLLWRRIGVVQPAAMVVEGRDPFTALGPAFDFALRARQPLARAGCVGQLAGLVVVVPAGLHLLSGLVDAVAGRLQPSGAVSSILALVVLAVALAWLSSWRTVTLLVLYRGLGGADQRPELATWACRWPRRAGYRAPVAGLAVASHPNGGTWLPDAIAGGAPRARGGEPSL